LKTKTAWIKGAGSPQPFGEEMDSITQHRINGLFERLAEDRQEILDIRNKVEDLDKKFALNVAWTALLTSLVWLEKLTQDL